MAEDKIIQISEYLTGKLRKFINARINSYTFNMECLVDIFVPNKNRNPLKESMSLDCVRSKLDAQKIYNVDFRIKFGTSDDIVYKRVCYRCFDGCRNITMP